MEHMVLSALLSMTARATFCSLGEGALVHQPHPHHSSQRSHNDHPVHLVRRSACRDDGCQRIRARNNTATRRTNEQEGMEQEHRHGCLLVLPTVRHALTVRAQEGMDVEDRWWAEFFASLSFCGVCVVWWEGVILSQNHQISQNKWFIGMNGLFTRHSIGTIVKMW